MIDVEKLARDSESLRERAQLTRRRAELVRQQASGFIQSIELDQVQTDRASCSSPTDRLSDSISAFAFAALDRALRSLDLLVEAKNDDERVCLTATMQATE